MREVNLKNIDLNLLVILFELLKTKHITQASKKLNMSQSATSRALGRLRDTFNDPLLIKSSQGHELSHRAKVILPELQSVLGGIHNILDQPTFDPKEATGTVKFFGVDLEIISYLPALFTKIRKEAPKLQLSVLSGTQDHFDLLKSGDVHFSMTGMKLDTNQSSFRRSILSEERAVCVMREDHPLAKGNMTLKKYLSYSHGIINLTGTGLGRIDKRLAELGHKREISIRLPSFTSAAYFSESSDVLFLMAENIANQITKRHKLISKQPPKELKGRFSTFYLYWHEANHLNPLCAWIREKLRETL